MIGKHSATVKIFFLLKDSITGWLKNDAMLQSAALAYFAIFCMAPLLIIATAVAGMIFSEVVVEGLVVNMLEDFIGAEAAQLIENMIIGSNFSSSSGLAALIGVIVLFYGAALAFIRLQKAIHAMWELVPPADTRQGAISMIKTGLLSAAGAIIFGVYLAILLVISMLLTAIPNLTPNNLVLEFFKNNEFLFALIRFLAAPILYIVPFALIYVGLPKAKVCWRDVWPGAILAAVFFWIGGNVMGLYFTYSGFTSVYGAAGGLVAILVWVFYSAMVVLYGAKFTQVYAAMYGTPIEPIDGFTFISE
jgi:membrane protein